MKNKEIDSSSFLEIPENCYVEDGHIWIEGNKVSNDLLYKAIAENVEEARRLTALYADSLPSDIQEIHLKK